MVNKTTVKSKKRVKSFGSTAHIYITTSANNVIITGTDCTGNTFAWSSAGAKGFKGSKKSTPYAAQVACEDVLKKAIDLGVRDVNVFVSGAGPSKDAALMACSKMYVNSITHKNDIPHNGCRPPTRRRV